ncbi:MAG TPA: BlaI/MecI/CopY family transcriptional regulator [Gammaproteobacteria bacterium]|nr:BlaI/MecI/CopY family transcriptional regulator [Gammaproteobacteria bacterium]
MKSKSRNPRPTPAELDILNVLWTQGPSTVRDVHERVSGGRDGYTNTLKLLQIMHEKGLVERDESQRAHVYTAAIRKSDTQREMLGDLVRRVFDGSREQLVMQALGSGRTSAEELARIRALLDELEKKQ